MKYNQYDLIGCAIWRFGRYEADLQIKNINSNQIGLFNRNLNNFIIKGYKNILKLKQEKRIHF